MKFCFSIGQQNNLYAAFLLLMKRRARYLDGASTRGRILHAERTGAARLNPMMESPIRRQRIGTKARAGVVNLEQSNCAPGAILHRRFNVSRVASADRIKQNKPSAAAATTGNMFFIPYPRLRRLLHRLEQSP